MTHSDSAIPPILPPQEATRRSANGLSCTPAAPHPLATLGPAAPRSVPSAQPPAGRHHPRPSNSPLCSPRRHVKPQYMIVYVIIPSVQEQYYPKCTRAVLRILLVAKHSGQHTL